MWLTVAKVALIAFLVAGIVALVIVYIVRRRRGIEGWLNPNAVVCESLGGSPQLPPPEWVHWDDNEPTSAPPG
jgi:hypothetical protein